MPIIPPQAAIKESLADQATPFNVTLAVTDTAEDLVTVPSGKKGRVISLINDGPGAIALAFDAVATVSGLVIKEGEGYSENRLAMSTKISFINVTSGDQPVVRGVLWSGP